MIAMPIASCLMPTTDRPQFVPRAIRCFLAQEHPEKELVIVDDGAGTIRDLVPDEPFLAPEDWPALDGTGIEVLRTAFADVCLWQGAGFFG